MVFFASIGFRNVGPTKKTTRRYFYMEVTQKSSFKNQEARLNANQKIIQFEEALKESGSQRKAQALTGIPRTNYQYWHNREQRGYLNEVVEAFFRQPEGVEFLHRLTLSAEFAITQLGGSGMGVVQEFYALSQLDRLVACSGGSLHKRRLALENNLIEFGQAQCEKLGKNMPAKAVTCALDETFPSDICLVGIETDSNFILLEQFADKRDCETWQQAMRKPLSALPVKVIQVVSDEAKALIKYTREVLGAHHSPDVFHVQQDIVKGSTPSLLADIKQAKTALTLANNALQAWIEAKIAYEQCTIKPSGRPTQYDQHIDDAAKEQSHAIDRLVEAVTRREAVQGANRGIGQDYHPFDLETGEKKTPEKLETQLNDHFSTIDKQAEQAGLSDNSLKRIQKAWRMVDSLVHTLRFFWCQVAIMMEGFDLSDEMRPVFEQYLLPMAYIEAHLPKARDAKQKAKRRDLYSGLENQLNGLDIWQCQTVEQKTILQSQAKKCAKVFQRSSSCVEGRNGQLSLKHHASRKMSPRQLAASTVIHHYFITRPDGTTAAERLFEQSPDDLFEWLLAKTDCPPFPAKKRSTPRKLRMVA